MMMIRPAVRFAMSATLFSNEDTQQVVRGASESLPVHAFDAFRNRAA
jgi:hypothetical protein